MSEIKEEIAVEGATVPFYKYENDGFKVIEFDTSACVPPEPMLNAMLGLELLKNKNMKLIMINHKSPIGLYPKIDKHFDINESALEDGKIKLEIFYKEGLSEHADLSDKRCDG